MRVVSRTESSRSIWYAREMKNAIESILKDSIRQRVFPGCVVGVVERSGNRAVVPCGKFTYEDDAREIREDSIYDVASVTKAIPTSSLLLHLIDTGKVSLEDQIIKFLPEFNTSAERKEALIKHLLTYTLSFDTVPFRELKDKKFNTMIKFAMQAPFLKPPGKLYRYTNLPAMLTGLVIEKASGKKLDIFAEEYFFERLGMENTTFHPEGFGKDKIVPTEMDDWRGQLVQGEVHDESSYVMMQAGMISGAAGLFSTVPDLLNFLEMILNKGSLRGEHYLSGGLVEQISINQVADIGESGGLGWELNQRRFMGNNCSEHTFGKTGFTGCLVLVDPEKEIAFAMLSNRIYPKRPKDSEAINQVRRKVADIVFK